MEQDINQLWIFFGILSVVGLGLFIGVFFQIKKMRLILSTPTSKIRSAAQGYTELKGAIDSDLTETMHSPLSQTPCYWFKAKVERYEETRNSKGEIETEWRTIREERSYSDFFLNDETGVCLVDPGDTDFIGSETNSWKSYSYDGEESGFLSSMASSLVGRTEYRFTEDLVFKQPDIYTLGHFKTVKDEDGRPVNTLTKPSARGQHFVLGVGKEEDIVKAQRNTALILGFLFLLAFTGMGYFAIELVEAYRAIKV